MSNKDTIDKLLAVIDALLDAIKVAGSSGIPSGHLYSMVMGHLSLDNYNMLISILKQSGKVTEENFLLKAV